MQARGTIFKVYARAARTGRRKPLRNSSYDCTATSSPQMETTSWKHLSCRESLVTNFSQYGRQTDMNVSLRPDRSDGPTFCGLTHRSYCATNKATMSARKGGHILKNRRIAFSSRGLAQTRAYRFPASFPNPPAECNAAPNSARLERFL